VRTSMIGIVLVASCAWVAAEEPRTASDFFFRGCAWFNKGEYDKAIRDYDESIRLRPNDAFA
jgi:hypothetical protein